MIGAAEGDRTLLILLDRQVFSPENYSGICLIGVDIPKMVAECRNRTDLSWVMSPSQI
jgi:hypothetical protein